jgi:hypothetical protein
MYLYNVVIYDGDVSWVSKFVLRKRSCKKDIEKYLEAYGIKVVYLDELYEVSLEKVVAFKNTDKEVVYEHFNDMYIK